MDGLFICNEDVLRLNISMDPSKVMLRRISSLTLAIEYTHPRAIKTHKKFDSRE